jgi:DNA polymerase-4
LRAAHALHRAIGDRTRLNCSIGIASSKLVAKVSSDQAKPNGVLWVLPGREAEFLAPLEVRKIPGIGKVMERELHAIGIRTVAELSKQDETFLEQRFGALGKALAGKSRGQDAGAWFDAEVGGREEAKSISHEHTFNDDTNDAEVLESTLERLSEMVARRLREAGVQARTIQLKLRYSDFTTITRAHTLPTPTQLDNAIYEQVRMLLRKNWQGGRAVRLLGVHASGLQAAKQAGQMDLLDGGRTEKWHSALSAIDQLRDKFGESAVSLGGAMRSRFRERVHENPAGLPGKSKKHENRD